MMQAISLSRRYCFVGFVRWELLTYLKCDAKSLTTNLRLYLGFDGFQHTFKKFNNKDVRKAKLEIANPMMAII